MNTMNRSVFQQAAVFHKPQRLAPWLAFNLLAIAMGTAYAQSTPPISPASGTDKRADDRTILETVTISATRRLEAIRDVPVAITKISTDDELDLGAKSLADVLTAVPGLTYTQSLSATTGNMVIRGVTTGNDNNPTVGIYLDDVPVGSSLNTTPFDQRLLDLANIEVLKGPQGTLYGASSMGGLLKFNTRTPDSTRFSGQVGAEMSQTSHGGSSYTLYGNVNVPLSQNVAALRIAAFHSKDGGFIDATGPAAGKDVNGGTVTGARLSLGLKPSKELAVRFSMQTQDAKSEGINVTSYSSTTGQLVTSEMSHANLRYSEPTQIKNNLAALNIEYDMGWAKAYSITGYQTERNVQTTDFNEGFLTVLPPFFLQLRTDLTGKLDKTTQEFRLVSAPGGAIEWLGGIFYGDEESDGTYTATATTAPWGPVPDQTKLFDGAGRKKHWRETALYGTVVWNVSPALALTAGGRAVRNSQDYVVHDFGAATANKLVYLNSAESPSTYLLAARYKLSASSSVYARSASGYRAGGPNAPMLDIVSGLPRTPAPYKSDTLASYEVGYKADLADKLGSIDVALFQIDWKNMQTQVYSNGQGYLGNSGSAQIRGVEFGSVLRPTRALTVRASASLQDPKLMEDNVGLKGKAGERLPDAPKVAALVSTRYEFDAGKTPSFVALTMAYTGDRTTSFEANADLPSHKLPAYSTLNVNGGFSVGGMDIGMYIRNLTDERGQLSAYTGFAGSGGPTWVTVIRPRTVGITLSNSF